MSLTTPNLKNFNVQSSVPQVLVLKSFRKLVKEKIVDPTLILYLSGTQNSIYNKFLGSVAVYRQEITLWKFLGLFLN